MKQIEDLALYKPVKVLLLAALYLAVLFFTNRLYDEANLLWIFLLSIMFTLSIIIIGALLLLPFLWVGVKIEIYLPKSRKFFKDFRQFLKDRKRT